MDKTVCAAIRNIRIGDKIHFKKGGDNELLKTTEYTVVGIGSSPLYISFNRGNTTLGSGEVSGFAYVRAEDFDSEVFTQVYLKAHEVEKVTSYTDAYDNLDRSTSEKSRGDCWQHNARSVMKM